MFVTQTSFQGFGKATRKLVEKHLEDIRNQLVHYYFYWSDARYQRSHGKINISYADEDDSIYSFLAISRVFSIFQSSNVCIPPVTEWTHNTVKACRRVQRKHPPTVHSRIQNRLKKRPKQMKPPQVRATTTSGTARRQNQGTTRGPDVPYNSR